MWKKLWEWVKAPLKTYGIKIALAIVQKQGDQLQSATVAAFEKDGPSGIDRNFDVYQAKLTSLLVKLPAWVPSFIMDGAIKIAKEEGDNLQAAVKAAAEKGGATAINAAFDAGQIALIKRLENL